ncbi:MAG: hypothetical protein ACM358_05055 [Gemmatimonadota bacterium]
MIDEDRLWRDERAATLRSRDRQREPQRLFPVLREGATRNNTHRGRPHRERIKLADGAP